MTRQKVSILTLGCKLNKYESDCMANILSLSGYDVISHLDKADIYIINTCAVTAESEKKSRQYITKCLKLNKDAKIIVCGCASQNNADQFWSKQNVFSVIGNEGKEHILELIKTSTKNITSFGECYNNLKCPKITTTRAYMKVQDGCNRFCSYCLIPYLRGRSRSRSIEDCVAEAYELSKNSYEIVLTGIDLSDFKPSLTKLMLVLANVPARIRIGSLEVGVITDDFLKALKSMQNFCPQFHLSLQSGCDSVLKRMNRHYTTSEYAQAVKLIRQYFPDANITTDIIVGFANETEDEFLSTLDFVKHIGFGQAHIFPYSVRKGTTASKLYKTDLTLSVKKERVDRLETVAHASRQNYLVSMKNRLFRVITEDEEKGFVVGFTENYIKVYLPIETPHNCLYSVKLIDLFEDGMIGEIVN